MKTEKKQLLGSRLKQARVASSLSQSFVAEAIGVTRQSVHSWEAGASCPSAIQLGELAALYVTCAHTLLFGEQLRSVVVSPIVIGREARQ